MHAVAQTQSYTPTLFDRPIVRKTDFELYDETHPDIWQEFESIAMELIKRGRDHYGAKAIFEIIRYHRAISGGSDFKCNNNFTAAYSRKFIAKYPEFKSFFELREKQSV